MGDGSDNIHLHRLSESRRQSKGKNKVYDSIVDIEDDSVDSLEDHIFQDPKVAEYYYQLYEDHEYECRHLFDPDFGWSKSEEHAITRKNDWNVTLWSLVMFTALNFDRGNLKQALADNFLDDLGLSTNQLNLGLTVNLIFFILAEIPSQLISKKVGADIWVPTQMCLWSLVTVAQARIQTAQGFYLTRALLGLLQGGFICEVCLWMSYFYNAREFSLRLSIFYIANPMTVVWSSILAFFLLRIKTESMPQSWRWLFLVEGSFTFLIGCISFFKMPASVVQTKTWWRPNGWFSQREEKILVNKILRDDPLKGDLHNREPVGFIELLKTLFDYDLLPVYLVRFFGDIGSGPVENYFQLTLRSMGFSTFKTNALTIPYNVLSVATLFAVNYAALYSHSYAFALLIIPIWVGSCIGFLRYGPVEDSSIWVKYLILTVLLAHPRTSPLTISWCSENSYSVRTRAVSSALVNIFSQIGGIVSANVYREDDAPLYHKGNTQLFFVAITALLVCLGSRKYYQWRNQLKAKTWDLMSEFERKAYTLNSPTSGNKRLDFKFKY